MSQSKKKSKPKSENKLNPTNDGPTDDLVHSDDELPSILNILPIANRPFFPAQAIPLIMEQNPWIQILEDIVKSGNPVIGLSLANRDNIDEVTPEEFATVGTACRILKVQKVDDKLQILVEGLQRFSIEKWISREHPMTVQVQYCPEPEVDDTLELKAYTVAVIKTIKELLPLNPLYGEELKYFINRFGPEQPSQLADFAASLTTSNKEDLQQILETINLKDRLEKVLVLLKRELEVAQTQAQIHKQVEEKLSSHQREFLLKEQLKIIQKELGLSKDDRTSELDKFEERIAALSLTEEASKRVEEELDKIAILETGSPEYAITRNYLDWLTQLPWGKFTEDSLDIAEARHTLDRDHEGLEEVKDRIIEFIAVGAMKGEITGSIILFVGPPGVGKTSLGRSIAESLGRKFYRFSVGGMRDEAEIKGHRRTYIGAMPGKFIQAIKEVDSANCVIMLDEIDKVGSSFRGDPASALLEVLDPEQNNEFLDHYLDLRFDLSKILFICTANQLDTIPGPLLDRMEIIRLSGYITDEKIPIASKHLVPKQLNKVGLKPSQLKFPNNVLRKIIDEYAREAGVRLLEKRISAIARKSVVKILEKKNPPKTVRLKDIESYLGKPVFTSDQTRNAVGVVTGLAWTALGGTTLTIEATRVHDNAKGVKLTGQLGNVMKESAEIAYSYISANTGEFDAPENFFEKAFIHLHVPAGATPKDGPSAGITMATALLSLARNRKITPSLAMTGELTLTGQVLPVGGIREKVIAAKRVKIKKLILPHANQGDFEELPDHIQEGFSVDFVNHFNEVAIIIFP